MTDQPQVEYEQQLKSYPHTILHKALSHDDIKESASGELAPFNANTTPDLPQPTEGLLEDGASSTILPSETVERSTESASPVASSDYEEPEGVKDERTSGSHTSMSDTARRNWRKALRMPVEEEQEEPDQITSSHPHVKDKPAADSPSEEPIANPGSEGEQPDDEPKWKSQTSETHKEWARIEHERLNLLLAEGQLKTWFPFPANESNAYNKFIDQQPDAITSAIKASPPVISPEQEDGEVEQRRQSDRINKRLYGGSIVIPSAVITEDDRMLVELRKQGRSFAYIASVDRQHRSADYWQERWIRMTYAPQDEFVGEMKDVTEDNADEADPGLQPADVGESSSAGFVPSDEIGKGSSQKERELEVQNARSEEELDASDAEDQKNSKEETASQNSATKRRQWANELEELDRYLRADDVKVHEATSDRKPDVAYEKPKWTGEVTMEELKRRWNLRQEDYFDLDPAARRINISVDNRDLTYTRISLEHVDIETLRHFNLDFEYDSVRITHRPFHLFQDPVLCSRC